MQAALLRAQRAETEATELAGELKAPLKHAYTTFLTQRDIRVTDSDIVSAPPQPPHTPAEQAALHPAVGILDSSRVSISPALPLPSWPPRFFPHGTRTECRNVYAATLLSVWSEILRSW